VFRSLLTGLSSSLLPQRTLDFTSSTSVPFPVNNTSSPSTFGAMAALTGKGSLLYSCKKKTGLGALLLNGAFIKGLLTLALPCFNLAGPMQLSFVLLTLPDLLPGDIILILIHCLR
jgi:hypothetical protein